MIKLQVGKYYKQKNGRIVGPLKHNDSTVPQKYTAESNGAHYYYSTCGTNSVTQMYDLVHELTDEEVKGLHYDKQTEQIFKRLATPPSDWTSVSDVKTSNNQTTNEAQKSYGDCPYCSNTIKKESTMKLIPQGYRELGLEEILQAGDRYLKHDNTTVPVIACIGTPVKRNTNCCIRPTENTPPSTNSIGIKDNEIVSQGGTKFDTGAVRSSDANDTMYQLISPIGLRRLAETMKEGFDKYGAYNWERGMPIGDILNHGLRHIFKYLEGDRSEDHLAHAAWNLFASMHMEESHPNLDHGLRPTKD